MSDKIILEPTANKDLKGLAGDAFKGTGRAWVIESNEHYSFQEVDGALRKSRGEFEIKVTREWQFFFSSVVQAAARLDSARLVGSHRYFGSAPFGHTYVYIYIYIYIIIYI